jgi:hypothetical protein
MRTFDEIKQSLIEEDLSREYTINGEVFEMTEAEFEKSLDDKTKMIQEQEKILAENATQRGALLSKLGITEEEAKLLLGGN